MSDIVDRLRDPEFFARTGRREELITAADEIEQLRYLDQVNRDQVAEISRLNAEIERLRERLGPRGLKVVMIDGTGHYVNEKVKAEIERLRGALTEINSQDIVERLRAEVDPDVNEPLDRLLDAAADEIERLGAALAAIKLATTDGSICNDVAWFGPAETLHDFCERILDRVASPAERGGGKS